MLYLYNNTAFQREILHFLLLYIYLTAVTLPITIILYKTIDRKLSLLVIFQAKMSKIILFFSNLSSPYINNYKLFECYLHKTRHWSKLPELWETVVMLLLLKKKDLLSFSLFILGFYYCAFSTVCPSLLLLSIYFTFSLIFTWINGTEWVHILHWL